MVSLPDGKLGNNALGYCSSISLTPDRSTTLSPIGPAWSRWVLKGTKVVVKWLKLPGAPEFLHVLDGETSTTSKLPRRLLQRSTPDLVTVRTLRVLYYPADAALYYGTASPFIGNMITVTPLGRWRCDLAAGSGVEVLNLSAPGNPVKNGEFGAQSSIARNSLASVRFLKDSPGG
ncbi:hypothetical protein [Trinickia acidisoli]|uniref:hypothetical protein n=1 Tax=Trinickia acidisoli TaxID=2767482 RepID=UPI001A8CD632|nr:hypothetical protein [Trinickia acidisoli]